MALWEWRHEACDPIGKCALSGGDLMTHREGIVMVICAGALGFAFGFIVLGHILQL